MSCTFTRRLCTKFLSYQLSVGVIPVTTLVTSNCEKRESLTGDASVTHRLLVWTSEVGHEWSEAVRPFHRMQHYILRLGSHSVWLWIQKQRATHQCVDMAVKAIHVLQCRSHQSYSRDKAFFLNTSSSKRVLKTFQYMQLKHWKLSGDKPVKSSRATIKAAPKFLDVSCLRGSV